MRDGECEQVSVPSDAEQLRELLIQASVIAKRLAEPERGKHYLSKPWTNVRSEVEGALYGTQKIIANQHDREGGGDA